MTALRTSASHPVAVLLLSRQLSSVSLSKQLAQPRAASSAAAAGLTVGNLSHSRRLVHTTPPTSANVDAEPTSTPTSPPTKTKTAKPSAVWTPLSKRVGLIALKRGMTTFFLPNGESIPTTVLQVHSNQVSAHIGFDKEEGYTALQVAAVDTPKATRQIEGHLQKAGIRAGKKIIRQFRVTRDALVPLGTRLSAIHFVPGQCVDVRGITRGHGFQGVMKRHGFHGQSASHGTSLTHRSAGGMGANQDPGRIWPGKKMPGRMGGNKHGTVHNLLVVRVDTKNELIYVKGNVPGPDGGHITVQDARRPSWKMEKMYRLGRTKSGEPLTGKEPDSIYLAPGVERVPFPAGDKKLASTVPPVVEIGLTPS